MDQLLSKAMFDKATIFESGYGSGFRQFEVRNLRFRVVSITGGGEYDAATFIERGKRKEMTVQLNHVLIIEGWDHPALEVNTVKYSNGIQIHSAKFAAFSPEWDDLLDEYLAARGTLAKVIIDGRNRGHPAPNPGSARSIARQTPPLVAEHGEIEDQSSAQIFSEGSIDSLLLDRFERDPVARKACLKHFGYTCQVCQILMSEVYGSLGNHYIHVHHRVPLSEIRREYRVNPTRDLVPVCPNCHSMLHRSSPPMPIEELANIVRCRGTLVQQVVAADRGTAETSRKIEATARQSSRC